MDVVVVMDPLTTVRVDEDTSFQLMLGLQERGHRVFHCRSGEVAWQDGQVGFPVTPVLAQRDPAQPFRVQPMQMLAQDAVDLVLVRTDPPVEARYLADTWLLDLLPARLPVVNAPRGLQAANEKLFALRFPDLIPPTLVTSRLDDYLNFLDQHRTVVLKPLDGHAGRGVLRIQAGDGNAWAAFELLSARGVRPVMVQRYLEEAVAGDKRLLLSQGRLVGAVLRERRGDDHRNTDVYEQHGPCPVTDADRHLVTRLASDLARLGLVLVGLDVIGGRLTEVNVTSPGLLQELNRTTGIRHDLGIVADLEALVATRITAHG